MPGDFKMVKITLTLILLAVMVLTLLSCSTGKTSSNPGNSQTPVLTPNTPAAKSTIAPDGGLTPDKPTAKPATTPTKTPVANSLNLESRSLEQALASGKPTLADFGATTCIPCITMKATLEELDPLYRDKVNIVIVLVNDDDNQELVAHYQIMTIPTQIFFDAAGKPIAGHVGGMEKKDIIAQFKKMGIA